MCFGFYFCELEFDNQGYFTGRLNISGFVLYDCFNHEEGNGMMSGKFELPGQSVQEQIFAIGDVHGQAATLEKTLTRIAEIPGNGLLRHLIFIGDIIDRGPENLRAIDLVLSAGELASVDKVTFLPGNHELMMLHCLRNPHSRTGSIWVDPRNGGMKVLEEIDPDWRKNRLDFPASVIGRLEDFMALIDRSPNYLRIGDLLFVHAGVYPEYDIDDFLDFPRIDVNYDGFNETHWAWIRFPFLSHEGGWDEDGKLVIIHGHTPATGRLKINPDLAHEYFDHVGDKRRICIDAGAAFDLDQIALLTISGREYGVEVIQDIPSSELTAVHSLG